MRLLLFCSAEKKAVFKNAFVFRGICSIVIDAVQL